jgi:hypothetical protein
MRFRMLTVMQEQAIEERRIAKRQRVELNASIPRGPDETAVPCVVYDMSILGACITAADFALPKVFTLFFDRSGSVRRRCKVLWRNGFTVGVRFIPEQPRK